MKILNGIACMHNLKIQIPKFNSNTLNGIPIPFKFIWIIHKFNWKAMGGKLMHKLLKICSWLWCCKITYKDKYAKTHSHSTSFGNELYTFQFGVIIQEDDLWNLKLIYLNEL
jgi:hypothetical protein